MVQEGLNDKDEKIEKGGKRDVARADDGDTEDDDDNDNDKADEDAKEAG